MPIYRGPDGKIIEERTRKAQNAGHTTRQVGNSAGPVPPGGGEDATVNLAKGHAKQSASASSNGDKTTKLGTSTPAATPQPEAQAAAGTSNTDDDERTRLAGVPLSKAPESSTAAKGVSEMSAGWLNIIQGPGLGHSLPIGYGANSIGRAETERVCLNFGDQQISRQGHAIVTYEPRGRRFYVQNGGGNNLTYLDEAPVLNPMELRDRARIFIGETTLLFVQLCGESFDWQDVQ